MTVLQDASPGEDDVDLLAASAAAADEDADQMAGPWAVTDDSDASPDQDGGDPMAASAAAADGADADLGPALGEGTHEADASAEEKNTAWADALWAVVAEAVQMAEPTNFSSQADLIAARQRAAQAVGTAAKVLDGTASPDLIQQLPNEQAADVLSMAADVSVVTSDISTSTLVNGSAAAGGAHADATAAPRELVSEELAVAARKSAALQATACGDVPPEVTSHAEASSAERAAESPTIPLFPWTQRNPMSVQADRKEAAAAVAEVCKQLEAAECGLEVPVDGLVAAGSDDASLMTASSEAAADAAEAAVRSNIVDLMAALSDTASDASVEAVRRSAAEAVAAAAKTLQGPASLIKSQADPLAQPQDSAVALPAPTDKESVDDSPAADGAMKLAMPQPAASTSMGSLSDDAASIADLQDDWVPVQVDWEPSKPSKIGRSPQERSASAETFMKQAPHASSSGSGEVKEVLDESTPLGAISGSPVTTAAGTAAAEQADESAAAAAGPLDDSAPGSADSERPGSDQGMNSSSRSDAAAEDAVAASAAAAVAAGEKAARDAELAGMTAAIAARTAAMAAVTNAKAAMTGGRQSGPRVNWRIGKQNENMSL